MAVESQLSVCLSQFTLAEVRAPGYRVRVGPAESESVRQLRRGQAVRSVETRERTALAACGCSYLTLGQPSAAAQS